MLECVFLDAYRRPAHTEERARALFRQALELVEQNEPRIENS